MQKYLMRRLAESQMKWAGHVERTGKDLLPMIAYSSPGDWEGDEDEKKAVYDLEVARLPKRETKKAELEDKV